MRRGLVIAGGALLAATAALGAGIPAAAGDDEPEASRVLLFSLPHVNWEDLSRYELPNLERLLDESGIADLTTRADERATRLGDGYLTLGAGTRAVGDPTTDGDNLGVDEQFGDERAGDVFTQRTGRTSRGEIVSLASPRIFETNTDLLYDAEIGALTDALTEAGDSRAVIGNGDGRQPDTPPSPTISILRRQVALGLMSSRGTASSGRVDDELLRGDPSAPYGVRLDEDAVAAAFERVWRDDSVVLVEASDLVRADAYRPFATPVHREVMKRQGLRRSDRLLGRLLEAVDLDRHAVIIFGPAHSSLTITTTVLGVHAPGMEPGLLRSATTRRSGFVQLIDLAPTILDLRGIERPGSMEGRAAEVGREGGSATERRDLLIREDAAAVFRDERVGQVQVAFVVFAIAIVVAAVYVLGRPRPAWAAQLLGRVALCTLAFVPATFLARLLPIHDAGVVVYWAFLVIVSFALGWLYHRAGRDDPADGLLLAFLVTIVLLVVDVLVGTPLSFNSVLGYSPTVAGRFAGFSNPSYAALGVSGALGAPLLARRIGGQRGIRCAIALLLVIIVVDGAPFWGSDVGGILSLVPAYGIIAVMLLGWRLRWSTVGWCVVGLVVALAGATALDLSRAPERRTHLGRLVERIEDQGFGDFVVILQRKLADNLATLTHSVWGLILPLALLFALWLVRRARPRIAAVLASLPELRAGFVGSAVLAVLGYALNDSGIAIPGLMLTIAVASIIWLLTRIEPSQPAKAPRRATSAARSR
jgi:hypothetical protein